MSETPRQPDVPVQERGTGLFAEPKKDPARQGLPFGTLAAVFLIAAIGSVVFMHRSAGPQVALNAVLPTDAYATSLAFTQLAMSESTSLSGGKSTFIDGKVLNSGAETLTGVTMQVLFKNEEGLAPAVETLPLSLIRTHEPYVDTESVRAAPLKPHDEAEFRLIFETVPANWNQQMPELRVIHVSKR